MSIKLENTFPKGVMAPAVLYAVGFCSILFNLSWSEAALTFVLDTISLQLLKYPEKFIFYKIYPDFVILRDIEVDGENIKDPVEQNRIFNLLSSFPEKRAMYAFWGSFIKVAPVGLFIAYRSEITSSFWMNLFLFYVADIFIFTFGCGSLYLALHKDASKIMASFIHKPNWAPYYRDLHLNQSKDRFTDVQNFIIIALLLNLLGMVYFTMQIKNIHSNEYLILLFGIAIFCICKVLVSSQQYMRESLESVFATFSKSLTQSKIEVLPVHTSPLLANFDYTFNQLSLKLEDREREISQWLKHESGQFHLRTLGEVTAMVAHDMKTPLSIMSMSLDMLKDKNLSPEKRIKYNNILEANLAQSLTFSQTLMAYVRGSKGEMNCRFGDVHNHLIGLFQTQYLQNEIKKITFEISEELRNIEVRVSRLDTMHVFYNLYQNAIKSVLASNNEELKIELTSEIDFDANKIAILLKDSGEGLPVDMFYKLIRFERFGSDSQFYHGLGLRLTNSILGHIGGELDIVPVDEGTCLKITLPLFDSFSSSHYIPFSEEAILQ